MSTHVAPSDVEKTGSLENEKHGALGEEVAVGVYDDSPIPKGTIDPVYEAKARVLNRAVCITSASLESKPC